MSIINILSAVGSVGTFIMALFYFISVSIQLYQMKMSFLPALGFNQILMTRDSDGLTLRNTTDRDDEQLGYDFLKLYNMGAGIFLLQNIIFVYINRNLQFLCCASPHII